MLHDGRFGSRPYRYSLNIALALYLRLRLQRRRFCTDLPQADAAIFGMFFGFASRNRRRSADEEKLPANQGFANITASRLAARKNHGETSPWFLFCAKDSSCNSRTLVPGWRTVPQVWRRIASVRRRHILYGKACGDNKKPRRKPFAVFVLRQRCGAVRQPSFA